MPLHERVLAALFQAVTPRTAGFNTVDLTCMTDVSKGLITGLMLIGGRAGIDSRRHEGDHLAVLLTSAAATFGRREETHAFERRIENGVIRNAAAILLLYLGL